MSKIGREGGREGRRDGEGRKRTGRKEGREGGREKCKAPKNFISSRFFLFFSIFLFFNQAE